MAKPELRPAPPGCSLDFLFIVLTLMTSSANEWEIIWKQGTKGVTRNNSLFLNHWKQLIALFFKLKTLQL